VVLVETVPLPRLKQVTFVEPVMLTTGLPAFVMLTDAVRIQPFASVTVTTYVPVPRPVAVAVVCAGLVFHE
jgi:hypothetical protein